MFEIFRETSYFGGLKTFQQVILGWRMKCEMNYYQMSNQTYVNQSYWFNKKGREK